MSYPFEVDLADIFTELASISAKFKKSGQLLPPQSLSPRSLSSLFRIKTISRAAFVFSVSYQEAENKVDKYLKAKSISLEMFYNDLHLGLIKSEDFLGDFTRQNQNAEEETGYYLKAELDLFCRSIVDQSHQSIKNGTKRLFGDSDCRYYSGSMYLKCAVNPTGDCQDCSHFQELEFTT